MTRVLCCCQLRAYRAYSGIQQNDTTNRLEAVHMLQKAQRHRGAYICVDLLFIV